MKLKRGKERILVISDLQEPFSHRDAPRFLKALKEKFKPTRVVCIGDELDLYALSDFDHSPDAMCAGEELSKAIEKLSVYYKMFPKMDLVKSNHLARMEKRFFKAGIPQAMLPPPNVWMRAPAGWKWHKSIIIDEIQFEHGDRCSGDSGAATLAKANGRSTVIGHNHASAGIQFFANTEDMKFGMNVGCLIDVDTYAFRYTDRDKFKPTLGAGIIVEGVPHFIPMILNSKKRWIGKL